MRVVSLQVKRLIQFSHIYASVLSGLWLISTVATAQPAYQPKYQFDHWTTDDGLPQNAVNALLQTRDGYLWLATSDGLARFDGLQFTVFNKSNTKGIGSNRFALLFEDHHGALWAVTDEDWLVKYQAGVFTTYTPKDGLPVGIVKQIEKDEAGDLQIILGKWLAKWKDGRFSSYAIDDLLPTPIGAGLVETNRLAKFEAGSLYWYSRGRLTTYPLQSSFPNFNFRSAYEDQYGTIWINTKDAGLVRAKDPRFTVYPVKERLRVPGPMQEDRKGNLWLAGDYSWLGRYRDGRFTRYTASDGFQTSSTVSFYEDREGNFWIGTSDGLYRARETAITVYTRQDGLSSDGVYSICEDRSGQLWLGTWGGGLTKYQNGRFTPYQVNNGPDAEFITALYEDRDGDMWIGNMSGLCRLDQAHMSTPRKEGKLSVLADPDGFFRHGVWAIQQDHTGRFWFGTSSGLIKYEAGRYTRYATAEGLAGDDVKAILEARDGQLWFGTWGGLTRYAEGRFTSFTERDGLASDHIRTLYEDAEGTLWIGTYDGGLSRFKAGRLTRYTTKDGLFSNGVFQILEDERGYFWIGCNQGIYRVKRQELNDFADGKLRSITSVAYGKADGLLTVECNGGRQPAGWKTRDGRLWFPTAHGAAVIDPSRVEVNQQRPPVVIEECRLNNEAVPAQEVVVIPPEQNNNLEIRYQGLSFIRPTQQRFKYRLEGSDGDWVEAGNRRAAYYNRLPPGSYTFTVQAANSDGVWNQTGQSIRLKVIPYWWEIRWVQALLLLGAMFVLVAGVAWRYQRKHALQQEFSRQLIASLDRERKRISDGLHNEPKQYLFVIRTYAMLALEELSELQKNIKRVTAKQINSTAERAREIVQLAEKARVEMSCIIEDLRPQQLKELKLTAAIEDWIARSHELSSINFTCEIDPIDGLFADEAEVNLYRIVQEGINNIVKHSQAADASVSIKQDERAITIVIEDNGRGFAVKELNRTPGSGLGLKLMQERAQMMGSKAVITSVPGRGTRITVRLIQKAAL
jgi:ligand-binding sensor domain-containing protein/signal transduction histidine kinase